RARTILAAQHMQSLHDGHPRAQNHAEAFCEKNLILCRKTYEKRSLYVSRFFLGGSLTFLYAPSKRAADKKHALQKLIFCSAANIGKSSSFTHSACATLPRWWSYLGQLCKSRRRRVISFPVQVRSRGFPMQRLCAKSL